MLLLLVEKGRLNYVPFGGVEVFFCHKREAGYYKRVVYLPQIFMHLLSTTPGV